MIKNLAWLVTVGTLGALLLYARSERNSLKEDVAYLGRINDSTLAEAASLRRQVGTLSALVDAAKSVDGKLVAGVQLKIPADTIVIKESVVPVDTIGETRVGELDTVVRGVGINVLATVPPFPDPITMSARVDIPALAPQVGFIKVGNSYHAVVSNGTDSIVLQDAFFTVERAPRFELFTKGGVAIPFGDAHITPFISAGIRAPISSNLRMAISVSHGYTRSLGIAVERVFRF